MTEPATNRDDEHVTIQYVADHLYVSTRQVRRWITGGKLAVVRLGHSTVRIPRASFDAFMSARKRTTADHSGHPAS